MKVVVRKFGGSCFECLDGYRAVAASLVKIKGPQVVVVSARKGVTDRLLQDVQDTGGVGSTYSDQLVSVGELESALLLVLALHGAGGRGELITAESVFETDGTHGGATITRVHTDKVLATLDRGLIPVLPGFCGVAPTGRTVIFKRGGSDYSAVALGIALGAAHVELCKADVDGIFDSDPNVDPTARRFDALTHAQALEIARRGGKVLQADSADLARRWCLPLLIKPAFKDADGTRVGWTDEGTHERGSKAGADSFTV